MALYFKPGRYLCRIKNQGFSKTKAGDDQFFLLFDIVGEINPADPEGDLISTNPGERTAYFTLKTDKNAEFFVKDMRRLGCPMTSFGMLDPNNDGFHNFGGIETEFTCEKNEYQGKESERWQLAREGGGGPVAVPLDAKETRRLDALFGAALKGTPKAVHKANNPANAHKANQELVEDAKAYQTTGEEIPF